MVVFGLSGAGKTTLAASVARGAQTREAFPDGVFWLVDGQVTDILFLPSLSEGVLCCFPCCCALVAYLCRNVSCIRSALCHGGLQWLMCSIYLRIGLE